MLFNCSVCTFFDVEHGTFTPIILSTTGGTGRGGEPMGKNGEKWGKMGKEFYGESILGLAIFPIFPHLKKNFERRSVFFKMA